MRITIDDLNKGGALCAAAGGALRVASTFVPYTADSAALELLYGTVDVLMLLGLVAIYLSVAERCGWTGLAGFLIGAAALASIVGPDTNRFGVDFYLAGAAFLLAGLAILSVALLRARTLRAAALLWLTAFAFSIAGAITRQPLLISGSGLFFGVAFLIAGLSLNNSSANPARARQ